MAVNSSANSVILILFAFSDNLSAENSKLSADSWNRGNHLFGCMTGTGGCHCHARSFRHLYLPPHYHLRALSPTPPTGPVLGQWGKGQRGAGRLTRTWGSGFPGNKLQGVI